MERGSGLGGRVGRVFGLAALPGLGGRGAEGVSVRGSEEGGGGRGASGDATAVCHPPLSAAATSTGAAKGSPPSPDLELGLLAHRAATAGSSPPPLPPTATSGQWSATPAAVAAGVRDLDVVGNPADRVALDEAAHNASYALAAYGWMIYAWSHMCTWAYAWSHMCTWAYAWSHMCTWAYAWSHMCTWPCRLPGWGCWYCLSDASEACCR
jgi:hypothetical protein